MKAMILAAGHGKRMRPLTEHTPKPLLHVGGKPLIAWHIEKLKQAGFTDIVINIAWLGHKIPEALGDGSRWQVNIQYSDEQGEGALETAGGIRKALPLLGSAPFLVVNGDVWCDYTFSPKPLDNTSLAHLVLVSNPPHNPEGDFYLKNKQLLPNEQEQTQKLTFSGIGYYRPELFQGLPYGKQALAPILRQAIANHQISGEHFVGDWRDIGTPDRLQLLDHELLKKHTV
jgi:MurNAc alpha-1-phosphate uridylyltransferase